MKLLHTSDWHLGHTLYNYDRTEEFAAMLRQMTEIVRGQAPDLFVLSGDVYHTSQPSASVQRTFCDAIKRLHDVNPEMTIVVTAGNHDSGTRHEIYRSPWLEMNVHCIGTLDKENPDSHIIRVPGKGIVVAVPYCNERNLPEGFFQMLLDRAAELNTDNLPIVMTAHTSVSGCDFSGHDNATEAIVGGIESMDVESFGEGYDYLALGHIHRGQFVHTGRHNVRYSGTPIDISFDECYPHSVSIVDLPAHGSRPEVEKIEIRNPHPLVTLPSEGYASWEEAKELLSGFPDDIPAYIRLNVEIEDYLPSGANQEAVALTRGKECRFCHINIRRRQSGTEGDGKALSVQEFQALDPIEVMEIYANDKGATFNDDMRRLFKEVEEILKEEERS